MLATQVLRQFWFDQVEDLEEDSQHLRLEGDEAEGADTAQSSGQGPGLEEAAVSKVEKPTDQHEFMAQSRIVAPPYFESWHICRLFFLLFFCFHPVSPK